MGSKMPTSQFYDILISLKLYRYFIYVLNVIFVPGEADSHSADKKTAVVRENLLAAHSSLRVSVRNTMM